MASHEWIQTELMRTANASQQFSADVWRAIVEKNEETTLADHNRGLQIARLNDALAFIQTADGQRRQEQANFNQKVEQWAAEQQATTEKLAADNAAIKADLAAIRKKADKFKTRKPTYLQSSRRTPRPPAIPEEPAVTVGGPGGSGRRLSQLLPWDVGSTQDCLARNPVVRHRQSLAPPPPKNHPKDGGHLGSLLRGYPDGLP